MVTIVCQVYSMVTIAKYSLVSSEQMLHRLPEYFTSVKFTNQHR